MYDVCMRRTQIYFTERQWKEAEKEARKLGISTAEVIRRVLDEWIAKKEK